MGRFDLALGKKPEKVNLPEIWNGLISTLIKCDTNKKDVPDTAPLLAAAQIGRNQYVVPLPNPNPPTDLRDQRAWWRFYYNTNPTVAEWIDSLVDRALGVQESDGIRVPPGITESLLRGVAHEFFLLGNAFLWRTRVQERRSTSGQDWIASFLESNPYDSYVIIPPDNVNVLRAPMSFPDTQYPGVVYEYVGHEPPSRYTLASDHIYHLANRASPYDALGISVVRLDHDGNPTVMSDSTDFYVDQFQTAWREAFNR